MKDFFWTVNGNRIAELDGKEIQDFLPISDQLKGLRKIPAQIYLESQGFSEEDAGNYLEALPQGEISCHNLF